MNPLARAEAYCRQIARRSRSNFAYAFPFLPRAQRRALTAVYAYCRLVDDAADEGGTPAEVQSRLAFWRRELAAAYGESAPEHPITMQLGEAVRRFPIRRPDLEAIIEGCEWDAVRTRYQSWEELRGYCFRVASAVGLVCIEIFGYQTPRARDYAIDLGIALQLTNILRDLHEDAARGRLYLPLEDLALHGVTEEDLFAVQRSPAVNRLLRFEAARARGHYFRARAALAHRDRHRLAVAEIMGDIYYDLLEELERYDFPRARVELPRSRKIALALRRYGLAWWGKPSRRFQGPRTWLTTSESG